MNRDPLTPRPDVAALRREYRLRPLDFGTRDPLALFEGWLAEAATLAPGDATAMTLATVGEDGTPAARIVLLKGVDARGLTFYTNYESRKGRELDATPHAALVLWWPELDRQVRVEGAAERVSAEESDAYFASRPRGSQLGAWASDQSRVVPSREALEARLAEAEARYPDAVPRPPHWGGYRVAPRYWEFWQGGPQRLHNRLAFTADGGDWRTERLAP